MESGIKFTIEIERVLICDFHLQGSLDNIQHNGSQVGLSNDASRYDSIRRLVEDEVKFFSISFRTQI